MKEWTSEWMATAAGDQMTGGRVAVAPVRLIAPEEGEREAN